jgi:hypothetical protein
MALRWDETQKKSVLAGTPSIPDLGRSQPEKLANLVRLGLSTDLLKIPTDEPSGLS